MIKIKGIATTIKYLTDSVNKEIANKKIEEMDKLVIKLKAATPVLTGKAADGWKRENNSIVNEVEYIDYLNDGSSQQAPARFIEQTLLEHKGVNPSGTIIKTM